MIIPAPTEYPSDGDVEALFMPADAERIRNNQLLEVWRRRPSMAYQPGDQMRLRLIR